MDSCLSSRERCGLSGRGSDTSPANAKTIPSAGIMSPRDSDDELRQLRARCDNMQETIDQLARWADVDKAIRAMDFRINRIEANLPDMVKPSLASPQLYVGADVDQCQSDVNSPRVTSPLLPALEMDQTSELDYESAMSAQPSVIPGHPPSSIPGYPMTPAGKHMQLKREMSTRSIYYTIEASKSTNESDRLYAIIKKNAVNLFAFDDDIWSASILTMLRDVPHRGIKTHRFLIFIVAACLALNIFLQLAFLFWSCNYLVLPSVREIQDHYQAYHAEVFSRSGVLIDDSFAYFVDHRHLCGLAISKRHFLSCVLFLWCAVCLREVIEACQWMWIIQQLPDLPKGRPDSDLVVNISPDSPKGQWSDQHHIVVCARTKYRALIVVMIFIPRLLIAVLLLMVGFVWLTASQHFSSLLLNALALNFITSIDETLFHNFVPSRFRESIRFSKVGIAQETGLRGTMDNNNVENDETDFFENLKHKDLPNVATLVFAVVSVLIWVLHCQTVLPHYQFDIEAPCVKYRRKNDYPWCGPFSTDCFPYGTYKAGA